MGQARLEANVEKLWSLQERERPGGESDVVDQDKWVFLVPSAGMVTVPAS